MRLLLFILLSYSFCYSFAQEFDSLNSKGEIKYLEATLKKKKRARKYRLYENQKVKLKTLDKSTYEGRVTFTADEELVINQDTFRIDEIEWIKYSNVASLIGGGGIVTAGGLFIGLGFDIANDNSNSNTFTIINSLVGLVAIGAGAAVVIIALPILFHKHIVNTNDCNVRFVYKVTR